MTSGVSTQRKNKEIRTLSRDGTRPRSRRLGTPPDVDAEAELVLLGALVSDVPEVHALDLTAQDFGSLAHRALFDAIAEHRAAGKPLELVALHGTLRDAGLEGYVVLLAEAADAWMEAERPRLAYYAGRLRDLAYRRDLRAQLREALAYLDEPELTHEERLERTTGTLRKVLDHAPLPRGSLDALAFSGTRLLGLLKRPPPEPVCAGVPPEGHLTLLVAPAVTGKTSMALWVAMARAAGVAPWPGAPARPAGRVLVFSIDEAPEQVVRRMNGLAIFHPARLLERYVENLVVLGPDRDVDPAALEALRFDEQGLATLTGWLERAEREGAPFADVVIDAYADVLPLGESENDNGEATRIGGALERLAVRFGPAMTLVHHAGKPRADAKDEPDLRFLGRGASALAAKARTVFGLELVPGMPHLRRLRTLTNLGRAPRSVLFEVSPADQGGDDLLYWKPAVDPLSVHLPSDYLRAGDPPCSTNELARRLFARQRPEEALDDTRTVPGEYNRLATSLREHWQERGLVDVTDGPRKSKLLTLRGAPHRDH